MYKAIAIVADTKKVVQNINIDKLHELRAMQKPIIDIEDLMAAIIMICKLLEKDFLQKHFFENSQMECFKFLI